MCYGYGFGDEHINRVISDMLTIPSTHLVILSFDDAQGRIPDFYVRAGRPDQISLLIGPSFANIGSLVETFLPKPAIDFSTTRMQEILKRRGWPLDADRDGAPEEKGEEDLF